MVEERVKDWTTEAADGFQHTGLDHRLRLLCIICHRLLVVAICIMLIKFNFNFFRDAKEYLYSLLFVVMVKV